VQLQKFRKLCICVMAPELDILWHVIECKKLGMRYAGENEKFNYGRMVYHPTR
jgi:hypothetical protein